MKLKATEIFNKNYNSKARIVVNRGGTRSSKTFSLIQLFILKALQEKNKRIVIVRKTLTILKDTVIVEMMNFIDNNNLAQLFSYNKQNATLHSLLTNTKIKFIGADEPRKFRGLEANYFWFNEADEVNYEFFNQAIMRMSAKSNDGIINQCFLDFNPSSRFSWVKTKIEDMRTDYELIKSSYLDNPFLSNETIKEIEWKKLYDYNEWLVYGLGEYTDIKGAVFTKYKVVDKFPDDAKKITFGMDFGFTQDPTTLIKVGELNGEIYLQELLYQNGLTNQDISEKFKELGLNKKDEIIADSAEPKSIEELKRLGWNIKGTKKFNNSVIYGLDIMKRYNMNIVDSKNILKEFNFYKYKTTAQGEELNEPIDNFNHSIDAIRYAMMEKWGTKAVGRIELC